MAAIWSDLLDEMSGANLQMEGHADVPPQSAKDLQEFEVLHSSPLPLALLVPSQEAAISVTLIQHIV